MNRRQRIVFILLLFAVRDAGRGGDFNVVLTLDTESADKAVALYEGLAGNPGGIARLRGSQIALATTALLAQQDLDTPALEKSLEAAKFNQALDADVFRMKEARASAASIKELLEEIRKRNFAQKVVSTVEQLFPPDTRISSSIPIFFVAFGHRNIDAYVRRVLWKDNTPLFVGEGEGELTIVVNLARSVEYGRNVDERFLGMMSVVAHEVFHAAFGVYKDHSPFWRQYYVSHRTYVDQLLDLAQNEGIAYYLTLVQRSRGRLPSDWGPHVQNAFSEFNKNTEELLSKRITDRRAQDILRGSNTSGYWESYGAMTGMIVAREIDQTLGREALVETVARGPGDFFLKYVDLMKKDSNFPVLGQAVIRFLYEPR
jgi:hypothetical protein